MLRQLSAVILVMLILVGCGGGAVSTPPISQPPEATISAVAKALEENDVVAFASHLHPRVRDDYLDVFSNVLSDPQKRDLANALKNAVVIKRLDQEIEYEIHIADAGMVRTFPIVLKLNDQGRWALFRL